MRSFEAIFQIPPDHRLVQVRSRSRGGVMRGVYWEHQEYDSGGRLIARYESFEEQDLARNRRSGWRQYDREGRLLNTGEGLPLRVE